MTRADAKEQFMQQMGQHETLTVKAEGDDVWIEYGDMYEAPALSLDTLKWLSDFFGTENISTETFAIGGCETCDWGSNYGHNITLRDVTKNSGFSGKFGTRN